MSVPSFPDVGKACRDFFNQGYHFGILKFATRNKICSGRQLNTSGTHTIENGSAFWELETGRSYEKLGGFYYKSKWNTNGLIISDMFYPLRRPEGLTLGLGTHYNYESKEKLLKLSTRYNHAKATLDLGVEGGMETNVVVNGSLVICHKGFLTGYQMAFDTGEGTLKKNNVVFGHIGCDFTVHGAIENLETYSLAMHHKTTQNMETGVQMVYTLNPEGTEGADDAKTPAKMTMGLKYKFSCFNAMRAKFNTNSELGLSYEIKLKEGATLSLAALLDCKNLAEGAGGAHKAGIALEFDQ